MANISKHLSYIEASVAYLKQQIVRRPQMLEDGREDASVSDLTTEVNECVSNVKLVFNEMRSLRGNEAQSSNLILISTITDHLEPLLKSPNYKPLHEIGHTELELDDSKPLFSKRAKKRVAASVLLAASAILLIKLRSILTS